MRRYRETDTKQCKWCKKKLEKGNSCKECISKNAKERQKIRKLKEELPRILELKKRGLSLSEIGWRFGVTRQRIHQILKEFDKN